MIVIIGKTASGKTLVCNKLEKIGFKKLVTYTTRPMRKGEIQDKSYHFISDDEFKQKIDDGFFAEWKTYTTANGVWYYGSSKDDYLMADNKTLVILTPDGYKEVLEMFKASLNKPPKSIYLYANNLTIEKRLERRNDNKEEAKRRIKHDNEDFRGVENIVDRIVYNNFNTNIDDVVNTILQLIHIWEKKKINE